MNRDPGDTSLVARCSKGIAVVIQWKIYGTTISCFQPDGFVLSHAIKNAQGQSLYPQKGPNSAKDDTYSKILTFGDDTAMLVRHTDPETTVTLLLEHIAKIEKWLQDKQMKANPSKCNHTIFTIRKRKSPSILLNSTHITQTKQMNYLGLRLDPQRTWKQHIKTIIDKIREKEDKYTD